MRVTAEYIHSTDGWNLHVFTRLQAAELPYFISQMMPRSYQTDTQAMKIPMENLESCALVCSVKFKLIQRSSVFSYAPKLFITGKETNLTLIVRIARRTSQYSSNVRACYIKVSYCVCFLGRRPKHLYRAAASINILIPSEFPGVGLSILSSAI